MIDWLGDLLGGLFSWLVELLIDLIVAPLIKCVIELVKCFFSYIFYLVSVFLLNLIDFAELLFRSLAGLDNPDALGGKVGVSITSGGKGGDLLIQFMRHTDVVNAFYACAIVGVFLLVIMTIFKMIQVEYTTEGAKNAKGPIIGKSLKALANMLLIPLLCIFGVIIGNEILGLIDTATKGESNATIAGTLFVTAATEAFWTGDKDYSEKLFANEDERIGEMISLSFDKFFKEKDSGVSYTPENKGTVEAKFRTKDNTGNYQNGYYYGNLVNVAKHYDIFEINYIVLIFGAVMIIKCLYLTCFGLIDRIYQCVALFIVSPMVIGMAPVKDNMSSWRGKFMSKALSAYGTVIAINLFFIIIKVVLSLTFNVYMGKVAAFSNELFAGLLKCIFVIVGTMMIEKLTGDIGGYFGAGNAMADGKGIAGEAMAGVAKVATVAGGGAMLAAKGAMKIGGGIANKVKDHKKKVDLNKKNKDAQGKLKDAKFEKNQANKDLNDHMAKNGITEGQLNTITGLNEQMKKQQGIMDDSKEEQKAAQADIDSAQKIIDDPNASLSEKNAARQQKTDAEARQKTAKQNYDTANRKYNAHRNMRNNVESNVKGLREAYDLKKSADVHEQEYQEAQDNLAESQSAVESYNKEKQKEKDDKKRVNAAKRTMFKEGAMQMAENKFGGSAIWKAVAPKSVAGIPVASLPEEFKKAGESAMGASDEGKAMLADIQNYDSTKKADAFDKRNAGVIENRKAEAAQILANGLLGQLAVSEQQTNQNLEKMVNKLDELIAKRDAAQKARNTFAAEQYQNQAMSVQNRISELNQNVNFGMDGRIEGDFKVKFETADLEKQIKEAVAKGAKMDQINEIIASQLKKMGLDGNEKLLKQIAKMVEELKGAVGK